MYVISRRVLYPDAVNEQPVNNKKQNEFVFDFKLAPPNERQIVQGRDYWVKGYLSCYQSVAQKQNLGFSSKPDSLTIHGNGGVLTMYKVEGEFDEWQIKVIKAGLASGLKIEEIEKKVDEIGWEKFGEVVNVIKS